MEAEEIEEKEENALEISLSNEEAENPSTVKTPETNLIRMPSIIPENMKELKSPTFARRVEKIIEQKAKSKLAHITQITQDSFQASPEAKKMKIENNIIQKSKKKFGSLFKSKTC